MKEAEAALALTDCVLKTRKDALIAKHIEGRESLHELDYIFNDPRSYAPLSDAININTEGTSNYLNQYQSELENDHMREQQFIEQKRWNLKTDDVKEKRHGQNIREYIFADQDN